MLTLWVHSWSSWNILKIVENLLIRWQVLPRGFAASIDFVIDVLNALISFFELHLIILLLFVLILLNLIVLLLNLVKDPFSEL